MKLLQEQKQFLILQDEKGKIYFADKKHFIDSSWRYLTEVERKQERDLSSAARKKWEKDTAINLIVPRWQPDDLSYVAEGIQDGDTFRRLYTMNDVQGRLEDILWTQDANERGEVVSIMFSDGTFACFFDHETDFDAFCGEVCDNPTWQYYMLGDWIRVSKLHPFIYEELEEIGYHGYNWDEASRMEENPPVRLLFGEVALTFDEYEDRRLVQSIKPFAAEVRYTPLPFEYGTISGNGGTRKVKVYEWKDPETKQNPHIYCLIQGEAWKKSENKLPKKILEEGHSIEECIIYQFELFLLEHSLREAMKQAKTYHETTGLPYFLILRSDGYKLTLQLEETGIYLQIPLTEDDLESRFTKMTPYKEELRKQLEQKISDTEQ